jgi:uncharacterized protein
MIMKIKHIISIIVYMAALIFGSKYFYLVLGLFAFMYKDKWIQIIKAATLKSILSFGVGGGFFAIGIQYILGLFRQYVFQDNVYSIHTNSLVSKAQSNIEMVVIICVVAPILEEIIFRKILFEAFKRKLGSIAAAIGSALIFSVIHFDFANIANYILIGLVFSLIYIKSKSLMNSMIAHMLMNTIILGGFMFGF